MSGTAANRCLFGRLPIVLLALCVSVPLGALDQTVDNTTITGIQNIPSSGVVDNLYLGGTSLVIQTGAVVTAQARQSVVLRPGTVIQNGAEVTVRISETAPVNNPPTVAIVAAATPSAVTGTSTSLSVLGADDLGESALTYTWTTVGTPPASVAFSPNGSNAAKTATATFAQAGTYTLRATITDAGGLTATSDVTVTVAQTLAGLAISPASTILGSGGRRTFRAAAVDQFGSAMPSQPTVTWSLSGSGTLAADGTYVGGNSGSATVQATAGALSANATVTVVGSDDQDLVVEWTYHPGGTLNTLKAWNRKGGSLTAQTTVYTYASLFSKAWPTKVEYPDTTGGADAVFTTYDRLGRVTGITDQRGVVRAIAFDNAGRPKSDTVTTYPTAVTAGFDTGIVPIPTAIQTTYDNLGRKRKVTTLGTASTGVGATLNTITWAYDAWGQVATAVQDHGEVSQTVTYQYENAVLNAELRYRRLQRVVYPDGSAGPVLRYVDSDPIAVALSRPYRVTTAQNASDGQPADILAEYNYLGANTPVARATKVHAYSGSSYVSLSWDMRSGGSFSGFDRFGRLAQRTWNLDATVFDGQTLTYDRVDNPVHRVQTWATPWQPEEAFIYDRANRLQRAERGSNIAPGQSTGRVVTWSQAWSFDTLGNWTAVSLDDSQDAAVGFGQSRQHNLANEIDTDNDHATQATTAIVGDGWIQPAYDAAGNLAKGPRAGTPTTRQHYTFDAWNRLCVVRLDNNGSPGAILAAYVYDGLHRKVEERAKNAEFPNGRTWDVWFSESWQELTRSIRRTDAYAWRPGGALFNGKPEEFYWDVYNSDLLLGMTMARDSAGAPLAGNIGGDVVSGSVRIVGLRYAYDSSSNVTAVAGVAYDDGTASAAPMRLIERSRYTPYGARTVYRAANWRRWSEAMGALEVVSASIARHGFGLGVDDRVVGMIHLRNRWYDTELGRFVSRDPIGYEDGPNIYAYVHDNPIGHLDPQGLGEPSPKEQAVLFAPVIQEMVERERQARAELRQRVLNDGGSIIEPGRPRPRTYQITVSNGISYHPVQVTEGSFGDTMVKEIRGAVVGNMLGLSAEMAIARLVTPMAAAGLGGEAGAVRNLMPATSRGTGEAFAATVTPGGSGRAFAGHGEYRGLGEVVVPEGTSLTTWTTHGRGIPDRLGQMVERGDYMAIASDPVMAAAASGARSFLPGARVPNYVLKAPDGLSVMSASRTVDAATPLSDLLRPGMGHWDWAACQKIRQ